MKKTANYEINHINETIILTKKFMKAASVMGTPEYKELKKLLRENPGFALSEREIRQKATKITYRNLSYPVMQSIIEDLYKDNEQMKREKVAEFESILELYSFNKTTMYGYVKAWFVKNYKQAYLERYDSNFKNSAA